ncbi:MAG: glycosyltransferase family 2 protein [Candidatus Kapaibacterium sp.]
MPGKLPLSISMIAFDEERNIARTLDSIAPLAAQIVVVDSHSSDRTREIAASFGAEVYEEDWKGHVRQKNSALAKCNQPWILFLDADEEVTPHLSQSISEAVTSGIAAGYAINRKTHYLGKLLRHAWQPDWNLRLVRRESNPRWEGLDPHDRLAIDGDTEKLSGDLIHYSYRDLKHHFSKTIDYAQISAKSYYEKGRKFSIFNLLLNPAVNFLRIYIINRGFLDGIRGLTAGLSGYIYTFLKYMFLWEFHNRKDDR